jgi:hypothetical protein
LLRHGQIIGMDHLFPAESESLLYGLSGQFAPALIHVVDAAAGNCRPDHLGKRICQLAEMSFSFEPRLGERSAHRKQLDDERNHDRQ